MKKYGLIGYPLTHSFSERYFTEKFSKEGYTACTYSAYPISDISELKNLLQDTELLGLNVTIPYKEQVLSYLDELDSVSESVAAVNTIKIIREGTALSLKGYNTDVEGFTLSLQAFLAGYLPESALVLGTGGASKAVRYSLENMGIRTVMISRDPHKGDMSYADLTQKTIGEYHLIINTTPLGTFPDTEKSPDIPYGYLGPEHYLFDLVYNPAETRFLELGKKQGARITNGYMMLLSQAEASWRIWNE